MCTSTSRPSGSWPSRSWRHPRRPPRSDPPSGRCRSPSRRSPGHERTAARPESALRTADLVGRGRARVGAARGAAARHALAGRRRVARPRGAGATRSTPRRRPAARAGSTPGTRDEGGARRCSGCAGRSPAWSSSRARSRSTARGCAPSARGRTRCSSLPSANAARAERLAAAHRAQLVPVRGADDAAAWCRERGLGLTPADVERLLGPEALAAGARARGAGGGASPGSSSGRSRRSWRRRSRAGCWRSTRRITGCSGAAAGSIRRRLGSGT